MVANEYYTQCTMSYNGQKLVAWIPKKDAQVGSTIDFDADRTTYHSWKVEATGPTMLGVHIGELYGKR